VSKGSGLETLIVASQTTVTLTQIPQAARRMGGGKVVAVRGPADFFGSYRSDGRSIVLDAKESARPNALDTSVSHLPEHQRLHLLAAADAKAVAGVLVEATQARRLYWCPARLLHPRRASVPYVEMSFVGMSTHAVDWFAVRFSDDGYRDKGTAAFGRKADAITSTHEFRRETEALLKR
jgi:hypothetical protein